MSMDPIAPWHAINSQPVQKNRQKKPHSTTESNVFNLLKLQCANAVTYV